MKRAKMTNAMRWAEDVLAFDPFAGDCEESRLLRDKIVKARKAGPCIICEEQIRPGDRVRSISEIVEDHACTNRFCPSCCDAMAVSWTDGGSAIEKRYGIGHAKQVKRAEVSQGKPEGET